MSVGAVVCSERSVFGLARIKSVVGVIAFVCAAILLHAGQRVI